MDDYLEPRALGLELEKASALQELRPHLVKTEIVFWWMFHWRDRGAVHNAISDYLARMAYAHMQYLIASPFLARDVDVEAFADQVLEDAKAATSSQVVSAIADVVREAIVDKCRVWYLQELQRRAREYGLCPIHSTIEDPKEDENIRDEWVAIQAQREAKEAAELGEMQAAKSGGTGAVELHWEDFEICFLSDERLRITAPGKMETLNYAEFGFADSRDGKPNNAWKMLLIFAQSEGLIRRDKTAPLDWPKAEKRMQEIRAILKNRFGISEDPLHLIKGVGFRARFQITLAPAYDS
jgi:hypothetical protein